MFDGFEKGRQAATHTASTKNEEFADRETTPVPVPVNVGEFDDAIVFWDSIQR